MIRKCICCEKEFEINNEARKYCYDCSPELKKNGNSAERLKFTNNAWKKEFIRLRGNSCQLCGYNKTIQALEFHHINPEQKLMLLNHSVSGNYLEKIKEMKKCILICANCHREVHYDLVNISNLILDNNLIDEKIKYLEEYDENNFKNKENFCLDCGVKIDSKAIRCGTCEHLRQRIVKERPEPLELAKMIVENGFVKVGEKFGVSDNAIRKWCKAYNIPSRKQDLKEWYENKIAL